MSFSELKLCQTTGSAIRADEGTGDAETVADFWNSSSKRYGLKRSAAG